MALSQPRPRECADGKKTKIPAQNVGTRKSKFEISISDVGRDTDLGGAGAKRYLRYLEEGLKSKEGS